MNNIKLFENIKVIGFDADDTLWENENLFHDIEKKYTSLLTEYAKIEEISKELFNTEMSNLSIYGYGVKSFTLSMIETALKTSQNKIEPAVLNEILNLGKGLLNHPVILLPGVKETLQRLSQKYRLIVATKGDLLDQERKLAQSGLSTLFHHIEIMSDKQENNYRQLLKKQDISAAEFVMIGNSLKSDILPIVDLGGKGIYIPYHITWEHEKTPDQQKSEHYITLENINQLENYL